MKIAVHISMQNGDKFESKTQELKDEELEEAKNLFSNLGKLNTFCMECEGGMTYFNPQQISSIQIKKYVL